MPEMDTYQPRSSAPRASSQDSVKQCSTPIVPLCKRKSSSVSASAARVWTMTGSEASARDVEVRGEAVALRPSHVVGIYLEVVEPGLADSNDSLMARRFAYPVERLFLAGAFRMQPGAGPDVRMAFGNVDYRALGIGIHADAQKRANADATRGREAGVSVVEIVQMAVRIDQHTYMVCVWRSDCSAPAR